MNFVKMMFALMLFIIGMLVGVTEIYVLTNPDKIPATDGFNSCSFLLTHATYLLYTISCLGSSYLLFKNFERDESNLK